MPVLHYLDTPQVRDNTEVRCARIVAADVARGRMRTDRILSHETIVEIVNAMRFQEVANLDPKSTRFAIYMAICFISGRRGIRAFTQHRFKRIRAEVHRLAWW